MILSLANLASEASYIIPLLFASASLLVITGLLRLVGPDKPAPHHTYRLCRLLLHNNLLLLLLGLDVAFLLFHWEWEDVGELLAIPAHISLANLDSTLSLKPGYRFL